MNIIFQRTKFAPRDLPISSAKCLIQIPMYGSKKRTLFTLKMSYKIQDLSKNFSHH